MLTNIQAKRRILVRDYALRWIALTACECIATDHQTRARERFRGRQRARKVLGWPKRCALVHAFLWEYSYKRLKLVQLLG